MPGDDESARSAGARGSRLDALPPGVGDFRGLVERLPLIIYIDEPDPTSPSLYISPETTLMLGYTPEDWASSPRARRRSAPPARRRRDVPREGLGNAPCDLHGGARSPRHGQSHAALGATPGDPGRGARAALPAEARRQDGAAGRDRGAHPLAASDARSDSAWRFRARRREDGTHPAAHALRHRRGPRPGDALAAGRGRSSPSR